MGLLCTALLAVPRARAQGEPFVWQPKGSVTTTLVRPENVAPESYVAPASDGGLAAPVPPEMPTGRAPTIFLGLATFRDTKRCAQTVLNAFSKAARPERVRIGIVQQSDAGHDVDCLATYCKANPAPPAGHCKHQTQVSIVRLAHTDAKGPTWARALQGRLVYDEDFCMQLDAHSDFIQGWDDALLAEWAAARNEYAVLSTYIPATTDMGTAGQGKGAAPSVPHICNTKWGAHGAVRNEQAAAAGHLRRPLLAPLWGAGLSFSKCHAEKAVPYDEHLHYTFDGEEFSRGARLWTHGPSKRFAEHFHALECGHRPSQALNSADRISAPV